MKIRIKGNPFTPYGEFSDGDILTDDKYPVAFLSHLVNDANAADIIGYETKIDNDYQAKKKPLSSQSSPQAKASQRPMLKLPKKKRKSSSLMTHGD